MPGTRTTLTVTVYMGASVAKLSTRSNRSILQGPAMCPSIGNNTLLELAIAVSRASSSLQRGTLESTCMCCACRQHMQNIKAPMENVQCIACSPRIAGPRSVALVRPARRVITSGCQVDSLWSLHLAIRQSAPAGEPVISNKSENLGCNTHVDGRAGDSWKALRGRNPQGRNDTCRLPIRRTTRAQS